MLSRSVMLVNNVTRSVYNYVFISITHILGYSYAPVIQYKLIITFYRIYLINISESIKYVGKVKHGKLIQYFRLFRI